MITADLCIIPMGIEESGVGEYVAKAGIYSSRRYGQQRKDAEGV